jgi:type I restriction enzyme R subunit
LVEDFAAAEAWAHLTRENRETLAGSVAGLPNALPSEPEEAKRFDLLMLRLQLGTIIPMPGFAAQQEAVMAIASALEEQTSIPAVAAQLPLIQDIQSEAWWQDVTRTMLEQARRALRLLVPLIEKRRRQPIYTDFMDTLGAADEVTFERLTPAGDFEKFRAKMRHFLQAHESHVAINKLRMNRPLTETDIAELERMLIEEGGSTPEDLSRARAQCQNLGLFVRSLIGLDRGAAKEAFSEFLVGRTLRPNQIAFLDMLVNHLTEHGAVEPERLYESPYTDMNPASVEGIFSPAESDRIFTILNDVKARAAA